ncbi:uncharacterized protein LOC110814064 [Carica papaya]|uniref:uncharacterized protein LOC110814064 n=1 Tax=Carica papaya TaxID=3649 RepID=UPI000B8CEFC7|nr:uncharacterized protein LOC110814064 [Carica papaya]XP_021897072.1 uncharacterized protein LOC110814064 [Carica papaya]XP_021897073.1 uncharacterized protein LOC110814064 [Carica papaya]
MFGISYGELFLLIGATAALVGPKDLPIIARTAGRLAGRAIGYVQLARGQFDNVMQQSQARQVHKELQDTMAQLEAIRYEIRSISIMNPGPMTRRLAEDLPKPGPNYKNGDSSSEKGEEKQKSADILTKSQDYNFRSVSSVDMQVQATAHARLAESVGVKTGMFHSPAESEKPGVEAGPFPVLPVSAESSGFLPKRNESVNGSDIVLEAVLEAEVAQKAKDFFSQPENQIQ